MQWYLVHTRPRQEQRALENLTHQGYACYLPLLAAERVRQGALTLVHEPLFSRYLFICLETSLSGKSWSPIRSTLGVSRLVSFGGEPARVDAALIEALREQDRRLSEQPRRLFHPGDHVQIRQGPFAGLQAIYQMPSGENRAMVLIEILSRPSKLLVEPANLRRLDPHEAQP